MLVLKLNLIIAKNVEQRRELRIVIIVVMSWNVLWLLTMKICIVATSLIESSNEFFNPFLKLRFL